MTFRRKNMKCLIILDMKVKNYLTTIDESCATFTNHTVGFELGCFS